MKWLIDKVGKTSAVIIAILAIATGLITCWQTFKSSTRSDISGAWKLKFFIESSTMKTYIGETHVQEVFFNQNESVIMGNGEKIEYNGEPLPSDQHRKIEYAGTITDNLLKASFKLYGLLRESSGQIKVAIGEDGRTLEGTFIGTAANTRGKVTGEKID